MSNQKVTITNAYVGVFMYMTLTMVDGVSWMIRKGVWALLSLAFNTLWAIKQHFLRLHRCWMLYPIAAIVAAFFFGSWAYQQQATLEAAIARGNMLAEKVAALQYDAERRAFRTHLAYSLAQKSAHTREISPDKARKNAFREFTSNGGPLWMQAQLIEHVLYQLESQEWPKEAQLVYLSILAVECGFNPFALNPKSSAGGPNQFVRSTAGMYGLSSIDLLQMDKNIAAGAQHFLDNWKKLDDAGYLQELGGEEWIAKAFPLFYQLHHDGQNSNLERKPSNAAKQGIDVGKEYIQRAMPVMFGEEPLTVEAEDFHQLVTAQSEAVVSAKYQEIELEIGQGFNWLVEELSVEKCRMAFNRFVSQ